MKKFVKFCKISLFIISMILISTASIIFAFGSWRSLEDNIYDGTSNLDSTIYVQVNIINEEQLSITTLKTEDVFFKNYEIINTEYYWKNVDGKLFMKKIISDEVTYWFEGGHIAGNELFIYVYDGDNLTDVIKCIENNYIIEKTFSDTFFIIGFVGIAISLIIFILDKMILAKKKLKIENKDN